MLLDTKKRYDQVPRDQGLEHRRGSILILGEETDELRGLALALRDEGYSALLFQRPGEGSHPSPTGKPDLIILDLGSSPEPARLQARHLKHGQETRDIPVIALLPAVDPSSYNDVDADDIVLRPLRLPELLRRLRLQLGRAKVLHPPELLYAGDLAIDVAGYRVYLAGRPLDLTYMEYKLLLFLVTHPDRFFTRQVLLSEVWGHDHYGGTRTVDVHIRRLRSKIEDPAYRFIETMRNVGYRFAVGLPPQVGRG